MLVYRAMRGMFLLRQALGMTTSRDARAVHTKADLASLRRQVMALRVLLCAGLLVPAAHWAIGATAGSAHFYERWNAISRDVSELSAHEAHNETLKLFYGDPAGAFYHQKKAGFSGTLRPISVETGALYEEKLRTVQDIHDYWHLKYTDEIYRKVFKAGLMSRLFRDYGAHLLRGGTRLPDVWIRDLRPKDLWKISEEIERDYRFGSR